MVKSSDLFVTVNTHQFHTDELQHRLRIVIERLNELDIAAAIFSSIEVTHTRVRAEEIGFELSPKQAKLHAHFTLELEHADEPPLALGPRLDPEGRGVNRRLQDYFSEALGIDGCYVHARLMREQSATKNYNRKQQQEDGGGEGLLLADRVIFDTSAP